MIHAQLPDGVLQEMPEQIRAVLAQARELRNQPMRQVRLITDGVPPAAPGIPPRKVRA